MNPDLEIGRFLTERTAFADTPRRAPARSSTAPARGEPSHARRSCRSYVPNEGDAWHVHARRARPLLRAARRRAAASDADRPPARPLARAARPEPPASSRTSSIGAYLESAALLGRRTAELHVALASRRDDPAFAPEPFTPLYQRSLYQSMRTLARQALPARCAGARPRDAGRTARTLLDARGRGRSSASRRCSTDRDRRPAHPRPRRLPPRPGAVHRAATS